MTEQEFDAHIEQHNKTAARKTSGDIVQAIRDVIFHGSTWRGAARDNNVSESGILRGMRRLGIVKIVVESSP